MRANNRVHVVSTIGVAVIVAIILAVIVMALTGMLNKTVDNMEEKQDKNRVVAQSILDGESYSNILDDIYEAYDGKPNVSVGECSPSGCKLDGGGEDTNNRSVLITIDNGVPTGIVDHSNLPVSTAINP